jgi:hypothetical protein
MLLSPVSSRTFIASRRNSPPGAPAHMHCVAIDVPLLEHIHRGEQDNVDRGGALRIHVAMSDSALYTYCTSLLRVSASNFFRLIWDVILLRRYIAAFISRDV